MAGYARFLILLLSVLLLFACARPQNIYINTLEEQRRALIRDYAQKLSKEGGRLILIGQTVRIIFPDKIILNPCSINLNPRYYPLFDDTARLMIKFEAISVQVAGYTNCKTSYILNRALSKRQAEVFAEYLFERGLDARLVHTIGYATRDPLLTNINAAENRRLEVSFQYLPLLKQY